MGMGNARAGSSHHRGHKRKGLIIENSSEMVQGRREGRQEDPCMQAVQADKSWPWTYKGHNENPESVPKES